MYKCPTEIEIRASFLHSAKIQEVITLSVIAQKVHENKTAYIDWQERQTLA
jgi:hypothetical protein